jgi:hypothetical protein
MDSLPTEELLACDESGGSGGSDESDSSDSGSKPLGKSKENKKHEIGNDIECDEPNPTNKCTCDFTDGLKNLSSSDLDSCQQVRIIKLPRGGKQNLKALHRF